MALLTYIVTVAPVTPQSINIPATALVPWAGNRVTNLLVNVTPVTPQSINMPINGGTYGPARGGTVAASNLTFIWGSITSG